MKLLFLRCLSASNLLSLLRLYLFQVLVETLVHIYFNVNLFFHFILVKTICQNLKGPKQLEIVGVSVLPNLFAEHIVELFFERIVVDSLIALNSVLDNTSLL